MLLKKKLLLKHNIKINKKITNYITTSNCSIKKLLTINKILHIIQTNKTFCIQTHNIKTTDILNTITKNIIKFKSFNSHGSLNRLGSVILNIIILKKKMIRVLTKQPCNGQRTKSNAKTVKKKINYKINYIIKLLKKKSIWFGITLLKKIKKTAKNKNNKNSIKKQTIKTKGLIKRSKNTKKSVWA